MRYGVQVLPPFVIGTARYLIAGPLMLGICAARGLKLRQSPRDFAVLAVIGILLLGIGNTACLWCEQYLPSGLAALLLAVIPLYVALIEVVLPRGGKAAGAGLDWDRRWAGGAGDSAFAGLFRDQRRSRQRRRAAGAGSVCDSDSGGLCVELRVGGFAAVQAGDERVCGGGVGNGVWRDLQLRAAAGFG